MSNEIEGIAPESLEAQVIADLQKEGHEVGDHQPIDDDGNVIEKEVEVKEPEAPQEETPKDEEPSRIPTMVETWKLKVAEDQKASAEKQVAELQAKLEDLSKQTRPITDTQKEDIADDIKTIAEESGVDETFLSKFANSILKKAEAKFKPSDDTTKMLQELTHEKELLQQENLYSQEFAKDIEPLVKEQYGLSDTALSQLKSQLKDLAFSDTYAKVPLAKILKAEFDTLGIKEAKRSSEGKGVKMRSNEVVDYDNLSEDQIGKMSPEQLIEFSNRNSSGWKIPS